MKRVKNCLLHELHYIRVKKKPFIISEKTKLSCSVYSRFYSKGDHKLILTKALFWFGLRSVCSTESVHTYVHFSLQHQIVLIEPHFRYLPIIQCWNMKLSTDHSYFDFPVRSRYIFFMGTNYSGREKIEKSMYTIRGSKSDKK